MVQSLVVAILGLVVACIEILRLKVRSIVEVLGVLVAILVLGSGSLTFDFCCL